MIKKKGIVLGLLILCSTIIFGSSENGFHLGPFIGKILNSMILFGGLYFLLRKPVRRFLGEKGKNLKEGLKNQKEDIQRLESEGADLKQKVQVINEQAAKVKAEEEQRGLKVIAELKGKEQAELEELKIKKEQETNERIDLMKDRLYEKLAEEIVARVEKDLIKVMDKYIQEGIIEKNIKVIGERLED